MLTSDIIKKVIAFVVAVATAGLTTFPPGTIAFKVCTFIIGIGGALGIISGGTTGTQPKLGA